MLSNREERELALLEQALLADRDCRRTVRKMDRRSVRRLWKFQAALGFGVFVLIAGMVLDSEAIAAEGFVIGFLAGLAWAGVRMRTTPRPRQRHGTERPAR
jgi:hypothetical protein